MLSSHLLDDVLLFRVSQTKHNIRGVKGSMLSSRLLDDVFMSRVCQTRDNIRSVKGSMLSSNRCEESMLHLTPRILSLV
jgi:hypothetical protein